MSTITLRRARVALKLGRTVGRVTSRSKLIAMTLPGTAWAPALTPTVAEVEGHIADYEEAALVAKSRAPGAVADRNAKEEVVRRDMEAWAQIVQTIADNQPADARAIIESAAMFVRIVTIRAKPPLAVVLGPQPGMVTLIAKAGPKGKKVFYEFQYTLDGGVTWLVAGTSTDARLDVAKLPPVTWIGFRYRINHKAISGAWSQVVTELVH
jgi:hypothetical protein